MRNRQFSIAQLLAVTAFAAVGLAQYLAISETLKRADYFRPQKTQVQVKVERLERLLDEQRKNTIIP